MSNTDFTYVLRKYLEIAMRKEGQVFDKYKGDLSTGKLSAYLEIYNVLNSYESVEK